MSNQERDKPDKDPSESENSAQPLTESQRADIQRLGGAEAFPDREPNQAEAAQLIEELQHRTGRESD